MNLFLLYAITAVLASLLLTYSLNIYLIKRLEKRFLLIPRKIKIKKPRRRYLVFEIASIKDIDPGLLESSIKEKFKDLFGITNLADSYLKLIYYDNKTKRGIIRIRHIYLNHLITTIALIRKIDNDEILIIPIRTSGTINKARKLIS